MKIKRFSCAKLIIQFYVMTFLKLCLLCYYTSFRKCSKFQSVIYFNKFSYYTSNSLFRLNLFVDKILKLLLQTL